MKTETGRYPCVGINGRRYLVLEHQRFQTFKPYSGPAYPVPTSKAYVLEDGRDLIVIDDSLFRIADTDELVWRIFDEDASFAGKVVPFRKQHLKM